MENEIKFFYDVTAERTADEWYKEDILKPTINDFLDMFSERPRILDLGCGPGHESMRLNLAGADVVGIDFSEECIRIAKSRNPQCYFEVLDIRELDNRIGYFHGVFACASLIHIDPQTMPKVINRIRNILINPGLVELIVQDGEGIKESMSLLEVDGQKLQRTVFCYTKDILKDMAEQAGLKFVREGHLNPSLIEYGWRNYIFRLKG
ncbi:MAG: class I SAM-dependent methyltransferase [Dehalobacterium sp.]